MYIALELIWQLEEESPGARSTHAKLLRAPLIESLRRCEEIQLLRIKADEVDVKGSFFIAAVVAQIEAMERGERDQGVMKAIEEASGRSIRECLEILKAKVPTATEQEEGREWEGISGVTFSAGKATGGEYDFLNDMEDVGDIGMGMDFEVSDMEMGAFGNWNGESWL